MSTQHTITLADGETLHEGDSVTIRQGIFARSIGRVKLIHNTATSSGQFRMVWVELPSGHVEGFKPDNIEKVGTSYGPQS